MSKILTTNKLVTSVKRRAMLPTDQTTFSKQDLIDILNEEVDHGLTPHILSVHDDYLVYHEDQQLVPGKEEYDIPYRAVGNKLRAVALVNENGAHYDLSRVELDDVVGLEYDTHSTGYTNSFYVKNNKIVLFESSISTASSIRMYFYMRISELVEDKYGATITNINKTTGEISVDKVPSTFSATSKFDFTKAQTPNKLLSYDLELTSLNSVSKILTFALTDIPEDLVVGDYITLAEETIVPQVPVELHPLLAQRAAVACLEALGDTQGIELAFRKLQVIEQSTLKLIDNRVEGSPQKINGLYTPLRQRSRKYGRSR